MFFLEPHLNKPYVYESTLIIILFIYILVNTIYLRSQFATTNALAGILAKLAKIKTDT